MLENSHDGNTRLPRKGFRQRYACFDFGFLHVNNPACPLGVTRKICAQIEFFRLSQERQFVPVTALFADASAPRLLLVVQGRTGRGPTTDGGVAARQPSAACSPRIIVPAVRDVRQARPSGRVRAG